MNTERLQDVTLAERLRAMASEMDGMGESDVGDLLREAAASVSVRGEPAAWLWLHEGRPVGAMLHQPVDTADMYWARKGYSAAPLYAAALSVRGDAIDWAKDARDFGKALNDAGWEFIEHCPEKSALLFNNTKVPLRLAILKYLEIVAKSAPHPRRVDR